MPEVTNLGSNMDIDEAAIDEGLYSRQLYALASIMSLTMLIQFRS